jgi:hypothetical protein
MALYLAWNDPGSHFAHQRRIVFQTDGAHNCGCDIKVQGLRVQRFRVQRLGKGMRIERFEDIEAWQLARELTRKVYFFDKEEQFRSRLWFERTDSGCCRFI